jgi:hypothetical protein
MCQLQPLFTVQAIRQDRPHVLAEHGPESGRERMAMAFGMLCVPFISFAFVTVLFLMMTAH